MKVVLLGDTHVGARKDSIIFMEYFTKFYEDVLIPYLVKNKITKVIQLGDFFDNRKSTNTRALNWVKNVLIKPLEEHGIEMWILCGNHDSAYKNTIRINAIEEHLSHYKHLHLVTSPQTVKFGRLSMDLIPWIAPENQDEIYDFVKNTTSKYCCGHFEFSGYVMARGIVSSHGIATSDFDSYEQVYSGHFHTHSSDGHINYIGTPYEMTWSDCNDDKGFWVLDTEKKIADRVLNPYKIYHKILYNDDTDKIDIKNFDYSYYKESYIRVIIEKRNSIPHFENFIEALNKNSEPHDISITDTTLAYREVDIEKIETEDPLTALISTIENDIIGQEDIDVDETKRIAMDIYNRAMQVSAD